MILNKLKHLFTINHEPKTKIQITQLRNNTGEIKIKIEYGDVSFRMSTEETERLIAILQDFIKEET